MSPERDAPARLARLVAFAISAIAPFVLPNQLRADDARVVTLGDPILGAADDAFIMAGRVPPLDGPPLAGRLRSELLSLPEDPFAAEVIEALRPPVGPIVFRELTTVAGGWAGSPNLDSLASTREFSEAPPGATSPTDAVFVDGDNEFLAAESASAALHVPPLLDLRLQLVARSLVLDVNPELRAATNWYREDGPLSLNALVLASPDRLDVNWPSRGVLTVLDGLFELRFGRDKLHLGPGRWQALSISANLPYVDFASARGDFGPLSYAWYLVRLNPQLSDDEERYLEALHENQALDPDTAYTYGVGREASKQLVVTRITWRPATWATLAFTQHNLIAGRSLQLADLNPILLAHNLFQDGTYAVPAMVEASVVPVPGLRAFVQYYFYDATFGDESTDSGNAGASAYQGGLCFAAPLRAGRLAGSRLRLDAELTYADPWTYGKHLSYRQMTSRYILVEPGYGRFWIDYPIGPTFGPDGLELDARIALTRGTERANLREVAIRATYRERGSITLLGYGLGSDYLHKSDFVRSGLVWIKDGQVPERRFEVGLESRLALGDIAGHSISLSGSGTLVSVAGYRFESGDDRLWIDASIAVSASLEAIAGK